MVITSLSLGLFIFQCLLASLVGYQLFLAQAAARANRQTPIRSGGQPKRFLILVPAHNEERLLPELLQSLHQLDYPASHFAIHVVADNCVDQTAAVARQAGAVVHERTNPDERGKGYALQWLVQRLLEAGESHDAFVILDADTLVSPNFLQVMDSRLARGERVIQAYYTVRNPASSQAAGLRYAALTVLHYLRPQGRMVLGGSAGLKGNGMVFSAEIMNRYKWPASVTEDIELHMDLLLHGERVTFAPDAIVLAEMPDTLTRSKSQSDRWEQGRIQMARTYVPQLLRRTWAERGNDRSFLLFDAAMEHIIPPFSVLMALSGLGSLVSLLLAGPRMIVPRKQMVKRPSKPGNGVLQYLPGLNLLAAFLIIFGQIFYLFAGLRLARAPKDAYISLLFSPWYALWKTWQYGRVLFGRKDRGWVRTTRNLE